MNIDIWNLIKFLTVSGICAVFPGYGYTESALVPTDDSGLVPSSEGEPD